MRMTRGKRLANYHAKVLDKIRNVDPQLATKLSTVKLDWYRIKNSADGETADLYIYDEIMPAHMVEWFGGGVSAEGLIEQLSEISASTLNVRINSPGGSAFEGIAIYNTLVSHSATINVYVDALAASAASIVAMAGDKITMMVGSQMMIHDAIGVEMGNAAEMRAMADFLDGQSDNIASIYASKAGGDASDWRAIMLAETWMMAQEAVDMKLADEVYSVEKSKDESEEDDGESTEEDQESTEEPEEEESEEESGDDEEELGNLMNRRHTLVNRGFKYAGRKRAPQPANNTHLSDRDIEQLLATW